MPFALIIVGAVLLSSGIQGTQSELFALVKGDLTGQNNYMYWLFVILAVGALGYYDTFRPLSRGFIALLLVVMILTHGAMFTQIQSFLGMNSGSANITGLPSLSSLLPNLSGSTLQPTTSSVTDLIPTIG